MGQEPGSPGRRLRLMRRKVGMGQADLAAHLGVTIPDVSAMENNRVELTPEAAAFLANPPQKVPPVEPPKRPPRRQEPPEEPVTADEPLPDVDEAREGPGPGDRAPRSPKQPRTLPSPIRDSELAELEKALNQLFAGDEFLVPRQQPDGEVIYVTAAIPGIAQIVGMADEFDGLIIKQYAPGMARAWAELARDNEQVRKILFGLTYGGAYRGVFAASVPPMMAIMAHHGMLGGFGKPPEPVAEPEPAAAAV